MSPDTSQFPTRPDVERRADELRRERERIEAELADLDLFLDLGRRLSWLSGWAGRDAAAAPEPPDRSAAEHKGRPAKGASERTQARRQGHVLMDAVVDILSRAGRPLHVSEIHQALASRGLSLDGPSPVAALNTRLWKRAQAGRLVAQAGPEATYRLADDPRPGT